MTIPALRRWATPVVYLADNWISQVGVVIVTTATVFWILLLPITLRGEMQNPYYGILAYLALPALFLGGLVLIPLGIALRKRREQRTGRLPETFPPLDFSSQEFRRLAVFIGVTTFANLVIAGQFSYSAVNYMDSAGFCGQTCHTPMQPEFTAYQHSPHSNVECAKCHIGPGAGWFVRSKLQGVRRVFAVAFDSYSRPIPAQVADLRPAREICEACHSPGADEGNRLRVITKSASDESNTLGRTVLLMRVGGGKNSQGIHGAHMGRGVRIRYASTDATRQSIPWVERRDAAGHVTAFTSSDSKVAMPGSLTIREMDCIDCHNRTGHSYETAESGIDRAIAAGTLSPALPFVKKQSLEILQRAYASRADAAARIPTAFTEYYRQKYPALYGQRSSQIADAAKTLLGIYERNIFPAMKVSWGSYSDNRGHTDSPGCFRCHDDAHLAPGGAKITQDCNACHSLLAMEDPAPKILTDLGLDK